MKRNLEWLIPVARPVVGRMLVLALGALSGALLDAGLLDGQFVAALRLALSGL